MTPTANCIGHILNKREDSGGNSMTALFCHFVCCVLTGAAIGITRRWTRSHLQMDVDDESHPVQADDEGHSAGQAPSCLLEDWRHGSVKDREGEGEEDV